jgi:lipopolysaccharide heptosyltransferase II
MNILQILPELNVGGVETGTVDFARYLVKQNHHSVVVSNGGALVDTLEKSGTKHYALPVHKKSIVSVVSLVKKVRRIIEKEDIDIVHARSRVPAWIAYFACRKTKASFITTCHGYYKNRVFSQIMGWSKLVIVPSEVIGRHMIDDFKVSSSSIRCIPRSVNLERFRPPSKKKRTSEARCTIAIVGRITPLKGHLYFIKAMAKVVRTIPYAKIWIIGNVPPKKESYRHELEVLVKRLGLSKNVEFLGTRKDVPELLSQCDVVVLSTITQEAFGRVILEAQALEVPVVATKVGGVVDIIDQEKTGLLVMPRDTEQMGTAVLRLLRDRSLAKRITVQAKKKLLENYTLERMAKSTLSVYDELLSALNILVIKISALGDVVLVTASLKAIRKKFPKARIHCLVGKESRKILQNCPHVDGIIIYDHKHKDKGLFPFLRLSHKLRKYRFDTVIDFQNNTKSHALAFFSLARESYGFRNQKLGFLLTNPVPLPKQTMPPVEHQFQILKHLGILYKGNVSLELWPSAQDKKYVARLLESEWLRDSNRIVGINLSASARWQTKNWPIEHIAQLCDLLSVENIRVVITGVEQDKPKALHLLSLTRSKPAIFVGKTDILQLAVLIKKCNVFITQDSAPMHVAAAMGTRIIALFGPTDPKNHCPPAKSIKVVKKNLDCSPCYSPFCKIMTHACMRDITPQELADLILEG